MEFIEIKKGSYYFKSAVNMGYIVSDDHKFGMLIDAGLETSSAKKAVRILLERNLPFTHLFITHAHADHFGGAQYLQNRYDIHTIAPSLEDAILRNPILEPIYLFHGNFPLREMRNKFLEAPSISIDEICKPGVWEENAWQIQFISLPGHSYNQFGLIYNGICYAADAYLGIETLEKHKIPFIVDAAANLSTLEELYHLDVDGMVPGHGVYTRNYKETIKANTNLHQTLASQVYNLILVRGHRGISIEDLIANMLNKNEVQPTNIGMYSLFRTAITAYLLHHIEEGRAIYEIKEGRPVIFLGQSLA